MHGKQEVRVELLERLWWNCIKVLLKKLPIKMLVLEQQTLVFMIMILETVLRTNQVDIVEYRRLVFGEGQV